MKKNINKKNIPDICILSVWFIMYTVYAIISLQHWSDAAVFSNMADQTSVQAEIEQHIERGSFLMTYIKLMWYYILFSLFLLIVRKKLIALLVFFATGIVIPFVAGLFNTTIVLNLYEPMMMLYLKPISTIVVVLLAVVIRILFVEKHTI